MMYGYPMMGPYGFLWMSLFWLINIALAAFIFGIIFWWTRNLVGNNKKRR